jgi:hypothetical protein
MIAAQLLAAHNATMECYRRAMLPEHTFAGRNENLNQGLHLCLSSPAVISREAEAHALADYDRLCRAPRPSV